jgi:LuxR family quorum-sensing transcriptional regulator LasR
LKWTAQGKSTWEIAKIFGCSEATVNFHMTNIRGKFGVSSRSAAAVKATRMGLIDPD